MVTQNVRIYKSVTIYNRKEKVQILKELVKKSQLDHHCVSGDNQTIPKVVSTDLRKENNKYLKWEREAKICQTDITQNFFWQNVK